MAQKQTVLPIWVELIVPVGGTVIFGAIFIAMIIIGYGNF